MSQPKPLRESWESFVERQILDAQESGTFDGNPGFGKRSDAIDAPYEEDWWLKKKLKRERIQTLPPSLQIRQDVEQTLRSLNQMSEEPDVRKMLAALNERIRHANLSSVWGPPSTTMPVNVEEIVQQWKGTR